MDAQRTLKRQISCAGIGLHSGQKVTLTLKPAAAGTGIRFRRTDLGVEIAASVRVDNVIVELNHREVPIMDGSSAPFLYLLQEAGIKKLAAARRYLKIL